MAKAPSLRAGRYTLRPLQRSDAADLLPTLSDPHQCLYLTRPAFSSEDELWGWLADPTWNGRTWIAVDEGGHVAARFVSVPVSEGVEEIGYITCMHRQGQGIAGECAKALIQHLFAVDGLRKVTAEVDTRNIASVALLDRLGFAREAHLREHEVTHSGLCDVYWYGILAREWAVIRAENVLDPS